MTRKRATIKGDEDYNPEVPQAVSTCFDHFLYSGVK